MHWFINPIKNHYVDFKGRATRKEYWMFMLVYTLITLAGVVLVLLPAVFSSVKDPDASMLPFFITFGLFFLFILAVTLPQIALQIRRLHDIGRSGWWYALAFIPYIGGIIIMIMSCLPSEEGVNKWGENRYGIGVPLTPATPNTVSAEVSQVPTASESTPN